MTSPLPVIQVLLDDGTGTFPYDVTAYVRLVSGIASQRGRADEQSDNQPGTLSITFDNTDGRFTPGNVTYGITLDRLVRVKFATLTRWTGALVSLPVSWPDGGQEFSVVQATATDALAVMARRVLGSSSDEEILEDDVGGGYYPMQEAAGHQRASDISGNNQPRLVAQGVNTQYAFGTAMGTPDAATGVRITTTLVANWLLVGPPTGTWTSSTLRANFLWTIPTDSTAAIGSTDVIHLLFLPNSGAGQTLTITGLGTIAAAGHGSYASGSLLNFVGIPHAIGLNINGTSTDIWVDGVKVSTAAGITTTWSNAALVVGDNQPGGLGIQVSDMVFSRFVLGAHVSDVRMAAEQNAMVNDFTGETPTARVTRVCGYAGVPTGTLDATGSTTLGYAMQEGKSALDCLLDTAQADLGNGYADNNGNVSYISGLTAMGKATPDAILDANWADVTTSVITDMTAVVNDVTGTTANTGNDYRLTDPTSSGAPGNHGVYPITITWNVDSDAQVVDRVGWKINNYSEPQARVGTLVIDMLSMDSTNLAAAISLDLGDYLRITGMPSQNPGGTQLDVIIEGLTETLSTTEWSLSMNVVQRSLVGAWVLGDSTWSVLESTTKLATG